jgi:hypothetical protein
MKKLRLAVFWILAILLSSIACSKVNEPAPANYRPILQGIKGVIQDEFEGESVVIYSNSKYRVFVAYSRTTESGKNLDFKTSDLEFPIIMEDNEGTQWDIFGNAISGIGKGDKLINLPYQVGYWFSFSSFYPKVTLYGEIENERINDDFQNAEWLIDPNDIKQGAFRDGIPSIDDPQFNNISFYLDELDNISASIDNENELVVAVENDPAIRVYPHSILNWHEIVNDSISGKGMSISYCPLTGTSTFWERDIGGKQNVEFGVSGLLYNNNLILYDRSTGSLWSQIMAQSINGNLKGNIPNRINSIEMNWEGILKFQKPTEILSENTGYDRDYNFYPYGNYKSSSNLIFPITFTDDRLHPKERVLALVLNNKAKVYTLEDFNN